MKNLLNKINPEWILRIALSVMYFYSGFDIVRHPTAWYWAVRPLPSFIQTIVNAFGIDLFLQIQGSIELLFALVLILWFLPKKLSFLVAVLTSLEMATILLLVGVDGVTFRDIGILGASLALSVILYQNGRSTN